ncbi:MAG TPA: DsbA family oxidoreductase [Anaeromyxobacter sp.]|nr:DsbA family oxidoreductase [Anaeromyxobacter sp.]
MMRIDVWADLVCPWCYLGKRRLERALSAFPHAKEVEVVHRAFELDPSRPRGRTFDRVASLSEKYGLTLERAKAMEEEMERRAAGDGLEYHLLEGVVGSTFDAHRLLALARSRGLSDAVLERLYRAHFTENRSIFEVASLTALSAEAGLDGEEARRTLEGDAFADEVRADEREARELGVTGVPFFALAGRYAISGAQPAELFSRALEQAWAEAEGSRAAVRS